MRFFILIVLAISILFGNQNTTQRQPIPTEQDLQLYKTTDEALWNEFINERYARFKGQNARKVMPIIEQDLDYNFGGVLKDFRMWLEKREQNTTK